MFNQLTAAEVVGAIGVTLRGAARSEQAASDFERDQLMSAYSATRHLAVELDAYPAELKRFTTAATELLVSADRQDSGAVGAEIARLGETGDTAALGAVIADLLTSLRVDSSEAASLLSARLRALLRGLADREVDLLADALS
jgi:hypothetical protein